MEGDRYSGYLPQSSCYFNPLPPYGGRPAIFRIFFMTLSHFNPLPPYGGRPASAPSSVTCSQFQSTPSVWRETPRVASVKIISDTSIHSLRMEGDLLFSSLFRFPRKFQSPPSVWRETYGEQEYNWKQSFQSTPSVWRETHPPQKYPWEYSFQSTPSVWRET